MSQVITSALSASPIRQRIKVNVANPPEPVWIPPEQAAALALIFNELATNSVKHAFGNRDHGSLSIRVHLDKAAGVRTTVKVEYRDDGPGWPDLVLRGNQRKVGLHLVEASVRSPLRGELTLRNDGGAAVELTFQLALAA